MPQFDDYRGFGIYYEQDRFVAMEKSGKEITGVEVATAATLAGIHKAVDIYLKKSLQRVNIIRLRRGDIENGQITSILLDGRVWIHWSTGENEKSYSAATLVLDTPKNRELMKQQAELDIQIDKLRTLKVEEIGKYECFSREPEDEDGEL